MDPLPMPGGIDGLNNAFGEAPWFETRGGFRRDPRLDTMRPLWNRETQRLDTLPNLDTQTRGLNSSAFLYPTNIPRHHPVTMEAAYEHIRANRTDTYQNHREQVRGIAVGGPTRSLITRSETFVGSLAVLSPSDLTEDNKNCHICLEPFEKVWNGEQPVRLPCTHVVGKDCLLKWLQSSPTNMNNNTCPIVRHTFFLPLPFNYSYADSQKCRAVLFERTVIEDRQEHIADRRDQTPEYFTSRVQHDLAHLRRAIYRNHTEQERDEALAHFNRSNSALGNYRAIGRAAAEEDALRIQTDSTRVSALAWVGRRDDTIVNILARGRQRAEEMLNNLRTIEEQERVIEGLRQTNDTMEEIIARSRSRVAAFANPIQTDQEPNTPLPQLRRANAASADVLARMEIEDRTHDDTLFEQRRRRIDAMSSVADTGRAPARMVPNLGRPRGPAQEYHDRLTRIFSPPYGAAYAPAMTQTPPTAEDEALITRLRQANPFPRERTARAESSRTIPHGGIRDNIPRDEHGEFLARASQRAAANANLPARPPADHPVNRTLRGQGLIPTVERLQGRIATLEERMARVDGLLGLRSDSVTGNAGR